MIKVLLITISIFVLLFLESFLFEIFSFSLFILFVLTLWKRINPVVFYILITLFGVILDSVNHFPLGTHVLVVSLLLMFLDLLSVVIPSEGKLQYFGIFLSISLYYILLLVIGSLLRDNVFPKIDVSKLVNILFVSIISTFFCIVINRLLKVFRYEDSRGKLSLD